MQKSINSHTIITKQPFAEEMLDWESEEGGQFDMNDEPPIVSFRDAPYESAEMKQLLSLTEPDEKMVTDVEEVNYKSSKVFPDWVLKNSNWKTTAKLNEEAHTVPDILKLDKGKRTPDQNTMVIKWLMSVWKIAFTMGFKRCDSMLKAFEYVSYQPGEHIIEEGKRGLTFYIIITGDTHVHKEGIGIVGQLGQGKSFGEVALTQGNDLRTATVTAVTAVECVRLHKSNFDYYVRDIQDQEKRENFKVLSDCKLFKTWPKGKIEKMSNSCMRHTFDAGEYIFHQGDPPNDLCIIVEGNVNIVKELVIVCKNRWPVGMREWKERTKRIDKPILLKTLGVSDFFGEVAILKDQPRSTSAIAVNRCVMLSLDKLEFLHLISYGNSNIDGSSIDEEDKRFNDIISKYIDDQDILDSVTYFRGGPDSQAVVGDKYVYKHDLQPGRGVTPKNAVIVGPTTHNLEHKQAYNKKVSPAKKTDTTTSATEPEVSLQQELAAKTKGEALKDKLRMAAAENLYSEKVKIDRLKSMGMVPPTTAAVKVNKGGASPPKARAGSPPGSAGNKFRKGSMIEQNGLVYRKASTAATNATRRGSLSFATRRSSLQGVDNDPTFIYDPIVLLRKNSAIQLGKVYEQVQRHIQSSVAEAAAADNGGMGQGPGQGLQSDPSSRGFGASRSTKLSPLRRQSTKFQSSLQSLKIPQTPPPVDALQLMSQWGSYMDPGLSNPLNNTASRKVKFNRQATGLWNGQEGSRKKSTAGPASPTLFSANSNNNMFANCTPLNSSSSIAAAIAQAVAFAKSSSPHAVSNTNSRMQSFTAPGEISASVKNNAPFSSKHHSGGGSQQWEEDNDDNFQDFMPTMAMARKASQASLTRDTSLKLLNKAKISYREVMEG